MKTRITLPGVAALCIGVGLFALGIHKLLDFESFIGAVRLQSLVSAEYLGIAAASFVTLEAACGIAAIVLVVIDRVRAGLIICASVVLTTAFYSTALAFRPPPKPAPCGCGFSSLNVKDWRPHAAALWVTCGVLLGLSALARKQGPTPIGGSAVATDDKAAEPAI